MVGELFRSSPEERHQFNQNCLLQHLIDLSDAMLWTIFEFCDLAQLCAISEYSPRLNESINDYFHVKFKTSTIAINSLHPRIYICDAPSYHFRSSIRNVIIYGTNRDSFHFVGRMWPITLNKITFSDTLDQIQLASGASELSSCIHSTMENVQIVKFHVNQFNGHLCDSLLARTKNMTQLIITLKKGQTKEMNYYKNKWFYWQYPNLRSIQWDDGIISHPNGFKFLLNKNKNLKHLIFTRHIERVLEFLERTEPFFELQADWIDGLSIWKISNLNRLDIGLSSADLSNITQICSRLNDLYEAGCYHQLYITSSNCTIFEHRSVTSLRGLRGIKLNGDHGTYISSIERAPLLRELAVSRIDNGGMAAAKRLRTLQKLKIEKASIDDIRQCICYAQLLQEISIKYVRREPLDSFDALNELREKLPNARSLIIYLEEWAYIALKQYSATPKKIEIRRIESLYD